MNSRVTYGFKPGDLIHCALMHNFVIIGATRMAKQVKLFKVIAVMKKKN